MPAVSHIFSNTVGNWTGTVTGFNSQGSTVTLAATALVRPQDWNSVHNEFYSLGGNTLNSSTASGSNVQFYGSGNISLQGGNNSVVISGPAPLSQWRNVRDGQFTQYGAMINASLVSIQPFIVDEEVVASFFECFASVNVATTTNTSAAYFDLSLSCVLYTRNVSTLNSSVSWSNSFTQSWSSGSSGSATGIKRMTANMSSAAFTLQPGEYFLAIHVSTANSATGGANTTALVNTVSMIGAPLGIGTVGYANFGAGTNSSQAIRHGQGFISTGATRATVALSDITATTAIRQSAGPYFYMCNDTFQ